MDRRILKTKQAIQAAYFTLLSSRDSKDGKITISDIARIANVDRKTFYLHYEAVDDIVKEFTEIKVTEFIESLTEAGFFSNTSRTDVFFKCLNNLINSDIDFYRHIVRNVDHNLFWSRIHQTVVDAIMNIYGELSGADALRLKIYAEFFASGYLTIYQNWLREENPIPLEQLSSIAADITNFGIRGAAQNDKGEE